MDLARTVKRGLKAITNRVMPHAVFRRRLPADLGGRRIYVSRSASFGLLRPRLEWFDPRLFRLVRRVVASGDVVWDIGGNVGLFAFAAAYLAGTRGYVVTVEPDPRMAALMLRTAATPQNESACVDILCAAVSRELGVGSLCLANEDAANNHLADSASSAAFELTCRASTVTLDWLLTHFPAPNVLKADIEGAERAMLEGATRLLSDVRPRMLIEVKPANVRSVTDILMVHEYVLYDAEDESLPEQSCCAYETLAIPREQATGIRPPSLSRAGRAAE